MCWAGVLIVRFGPASAWQFWHALSLGCGAGGGAPWHDVHCFCVPSTLVHAGEVAVPPAGVPAEVLSVEPWQ